MIAELCVPKNPGNKYPQKETYQDSCLVDVSTSFDENAKSIGMIFVGGPVRSGALELEIFCMSERFADEQA